MFKKFVFTLSLLAAQSNFCMEEDGLDLEIVSSVGTVAKKFAGKIVVYQPPMLDRNTECPLQYGFVHPDFMRLPGKRKGYRLFTAQAVLPGCQRGYCLDTGRVTSGQPSSPCFLLGHDMAMQGDWFMRLLTLEEARAINEAFESGHKLFKVQDRSLLPDNGKKFFRLSDLVESEQEKYLVEQRVPADVQPHPDTPLNLN
jgi:hypothetical protein